MTSTDIIRLAALRVKLRQGQVLPESYRANPSTFFREVLGAEPFPKQEEILEAVRDHRRVAVVGAQGTGKDWTAGRAVLWWLWTQRPAKVIILGPTHRQVASIVWKETRLAYFQALRPLGGRMLETPRWEIDDETFALGFATDQPYNIQGFHSPNLLLIYTEAHGCRQEDFEAGKRLNPARVLMTGNPLTVTGEFYDAFHGMADLWYGIRISAHDTPNVQTGQDTVPGLVNVRDVEERKREWGEDSALYQASVLGEFPESLEDVLIRRSWVDRAIEAKLEPEGLPILGCDVAAGGDDTVIVRREGPKARVIWRGKTPDVMSIPGRLKAYLEEHPECENRVVVDQTGMGIGICHRLREVGVKAIEFIAGEQAVDPRRYVNKQAEAWALMADAFREGRIDIEKDGALVSQLCSRRVEIQSDRRLKLESKDVLKSRGGRSPDEADALALTFSPIAHRRLKLWA